MADDHDSGSVFLAFLMGGVAGAVLALLYAPRTGRETREFLGEKLRESGERGRDIRDRAVEKGRELREQAMEKGRSLASDAGAFVERQREALDDRRERLSAAVEAGKQAFREEKGKAKSGA